MRRTAIHCWLFASCLPRIAACPPESAFYAVAWFSRPRPAGVCVLFGIFPVAMRKYPGCFFLLLLLTWQAARTAPAFQDFPFHHLTTADGLSSNTTTCLTEDQQGFIWIGTNNGLNRWDGYRMKQYFHDDADAHSLVFNGIQTLYCDRKGRIWVTTGGGVSCFLPDRNLFINYTVDSDPVHRLKNNSGVRIAEEKDGSLWLLCQQEVIFRIGENLDLQPTIVRQAPFSFENILKAGYDGMLMARDGKEWAFCANRIYGVNTVDHQPTLALDFSRQLGHASIHKMVEDSLGRIWVMTWGSTLWQFLPEQHRLVPLQKIPALDLAEWTYQGRRWIIATTPYSGVYASLEEGDSLHQLNWNPADVYSLSGIEFNAVYPDRHRNLWICGNNGVNFVPTANRIFDVIPVTNPGTANYDRGTLEIPYSFMEDGSDCWLAKRYKATFQYDSDFRVRNCFTSLYPLSVTDVRWRQSAYYFLKEGADIYMTTDTGLIVYRGVGLGTRLYVPPGLTGAADLRTMVKTGENKILIRSVSHGLFLFDIHTHSFSRPPADSLPARLNYLLRTNRGELYLSSDEDRGLIRYDLATGACRPVHPVNEPLFHLRAKRIFGMAEDGNGRLWLASGNGLYIYDPIRNHIDMHYSADGRMGQLFRVCFDRDQNAWVNGNSGIWCHVARSGKWINFNGQDGLPGSDFEGIIACRRNGDVVAGLQGAIAVFHPSRLEAEDASPAAVITEAVVGSLPHLFPLVKGALKKMNLRAGENSFSVDFSIPDRVIDGGLQYLYRLEPTMKADAVNSNGHINFNGLSPGHYWLHVRGQGKAGEAIGEEDMLEINIAPNWYQSMKFRLAVLCLSALAVFLVVKRRIAAIRNESALRQRIVETEMQALRAQMDPHFIFNSLSSIENFIMRNEKRLASDYLNKFARLIRMILDSSRSELVPLARDMEALQLYIDLEQISCNNKFLYCPTIDPSLLREDFHVPPLLIQPYVENAIVHGLMPSRGDQLRLEIRAWLAGDTIHYTIEDNGIGREQAMRYKLRNKPHHQSVGMQITEERIRIFNRRTKSKGSVTITDLYDTDNNPAGTRVEMIIKAM